MWIRYKYLPDTSVNFGGGRSDATDAIIFISAVLVIGIYLYSY